MLYLHIFFSLLFIILGVIITKKVFNPLSCFNILWLLIILLYNLQLSRLFTDLSFKTYIVLIINIFFFSLAFLVGYLIRIKKHLKEENFVISYKKILKLFKFWLFIEIIETIYSGGLPVIWKLTGNIKTYTAYGIPTLHGLMNSLGLVIAILSFYKFLKDKDKKLLKIVATIFIYYLCVISRQVLISLIIEIMVIYLFFNKKIPWKKLIIIFFITVIGFGIIGNFRTGYENFLNVSAFKNIHAPKMFIGVYWLYMYLTSLLININYAINSNISGFGLLPLFQHYVPTIIYRILYANNPVSIPSIVVYSSYNVSGYFADFLIGYGIKGVAIMSFIYGFLGGIFLYKVEKNANEKNILYYAVYMQIILLSFVSNHLFYLPSGFQLFIIYVLFNSKKQKNVIKR